MFVFLDDLRSQDLLKIEAVKASLREQIGRDPTLAEWAKALDMDVGAFSTRLNEGRHAKDRMIQCNLRLVVSVAKKYQGKGMTVQDLIQVSKIFQYLFCGMIRNDGRGKIVK